MWFNELSANDLQILQHANTPRKRGLSCATPCEDQHETVSHKPIHAVGTKNYSNVQEFLEQANLESGFDANQKILSKPVGGIANVGAM